MQVSFAHPLPARLVLSTVHIGQVKVERLPGDNLRITGASSPEHEAAITAWYWEHVGIKGGDPKEEDGKVNV